MTLTDLRLMMISVILIFGVHAVFTQNPTLPLFDTLQGTVQVVDLVAASLTVHTHGSEYNLVADSMTRFPPGRSLDSLSQGTEVIVIGERCENDLYLREVILPDPDRGRTRQPVFAVSAAPPATGPDTTGSGTGQMSQPEKQDTLP